MLALIATVVSIAVVDAINPSTLVPALFIAAGPRPVRQVIRFGAGVLAVTLAGGLVVLLGPGELLLDLVPRPDPATTDWIQAGAGIALIVAGAAAWWRRGWLARRGADARAAASDGSDARGGPQEASRRPMILLGAGIAGLGLPANVAYLGAITTIVGSGRGVLVQLLLLGLYDAVFILPMASIVLVLALAPARSEAILGVARRLLTERWVPALVVLLVIAGVVVLGVGVSGLAGPG